MSKKYIFVGNQPKDLLEELIDVWIRTDVMHEYAIGKPKGHNVLPKGSSKQAIRKKLAEDGEVGTYRLRSSIPEHVLEMTGL